jgi:hypothetical protein
MGRPRKDGKTLRAKPRGVRLHPKLLQRVDKAIDAGKIPGVDTFTGAVEVALTAVVDRIDERGTY